MKTVDSSWPGRHCQPATPITPTLYLLFALNKLTFTVFYIWKFFSKLLSDCLNNIHVLQLRLLIPKTLFLQ